MSAVADGPLGAHVSITLECVVARIVTWPCADFERCVAQFRRNEAIELRDGPPAAMAEGGARIDRSLRLQKGTSRRNHLDFYVRSGNVLPHLRGNTKSMKAYFEEEIAVRAGREDKK